MKGKGLLMMLLGAAPGCELADPPRDLSETAVPYDSASIVEATTDYSVAPDISGLVGLRYPPLPLGLDDLGGTVLENGESDWVLKSARLRGRPILILSEIVDWTETYREIRDGRRIGRSRTPVLEIRDVIYLPPLESDERLVWRLCADPTGSPLIAYVRVDRSARLMRDVRLAWFADLDAGELTSASASGATCVNTAWGRN